MSILIFIIILGALIFVHELGHFWVAKKNGIRVDEFAIGFPPKVFSWTRGGTKYALNMIPFGGYVKIFGENPDEDSLDKNAKDSFVNKSKWVQSAVLIAGVTFNVIFAWILFAIAFMIGFNVPKDIFSFVDNSQSEIQVIAVSENTPAERLGLKSGDSVSGLNKDDMLFSFASSEEALGLIRETSAPFILQTSRGEISIESKLKTEEGEVVGFYLSDVVNTKTNPISALWHSVLITGFTLKETTIAIFNLLVDAFQGDAKLENIAGPVGIVGLVGDAAKAGFVNVIIFTAFISINLAIINLFPFPALDGGRLFFILIEVITRKPINPKIANILNLVGFLILIGLMVLVTVSDISKIENFWPF